MYGIYKHRRRCASFVSTHVCVHMYNIHTHMCVHMYNIHTCVCTCVQYTHTCLYNIHTCVCTYVKYTHTCVYMCTIYTNVHKYGIYKHRQTMCKLCIYTHACTLCTYVCKYVCTYVCTYVQALYIHTCVYMYTTYTNTGGRRYAVSKYELYCMQNIYNMCTI